MAFACGKTIKGNTLTKVLRIPVPANPAGWLNIPVQINAAFAVLQQQADQEADRATDGDCDRSCPIKGGFKAFNPQVINAQIGTKIVGNVRTLEFIFTLQLDWQAMVICVKRHAGFRNTPLSTISWEDFQAKLEEDKHRPQP